MQKKRHSNTHHTVRENNRKQLQQSEEWTIARTEQLSSKHT